MNHYQIEYVIQPNAAGYDEVKTTCSFTFNNIYHARDYASALTKANIDHRYGYVKRASVLLGGELLDTFFRELSCQHVWEHLHGTDKNNEFRCHKCGERK